MGRATHPARRIWAGLFRGALALGLSWAVACGVGACSDNCRGVFIDGVCEKACADEYCATGQRCVENDCANPCESNDQCPLGKHCALWGFPDGTQGQFCVSVEGKAGGQSAPCDGDADCDTERGFRCVSNQCLIAGCRSHDDCWPMGLCTPSVLDGQPINVCMPSDPAPVLGQLGAPCPDGDAACDTTAGFHCLGTPPGDVAAYCTTYDCTSDEDCGTGYACLRVPAEEPPFDSSKATVPCESACGFDGQNAENCAPLDEIGPGKTYECGPTSLMRTMCRKREYCSPCESDVDCLGHPNQICARDMGGAKICTVACDPDTNSCPWGNASECNVWDTERGIPTCAHRFGSCVGTGAGCEPCLQHSDCGADGVCYTAPFTNERFCIDLTLKCTCDAETTTGDCIGGGCPTAPSGAQMFCLGGSQYSGSLFYQACFGAQINFDPFDPSPLTGCWRR